MNNSTPHCKTLFVSFAGDIFINFLNLVWIMKNLKYLIIVSGLLLITSCSKFDSDFELIEEL